MLKIYEKVIFLAIVLCTLSIYIISLAPGITVSNLGMDTGEFALCARDLGIPHPTGYPVFNLIGKIFCMNPLVQNREIAYRTNVLSAVFAAFTVGILYLILKILTGNVLISVFAALCFGVTKTFWSQAVITEVYTLNLFFVSLFIFFAVNYIKNKSEEKYFWGCTFAIGMGLTNHTICILLIPVYFFLIYLKPSIITIKKVSFGLFIIALCGFSYMYLPIRAVKDPVINIGNPGNLKNLFWVLMAKPFQHNMFSFPSGKLYYQISEYPILMQFTLFEILIGVIGFWELLKKQTEICFALLILFLLNIGYSLNYDISDIGAYFLLSYLIYAVWIGFGFKSIYESLGSFIDKFFSVKLLLIAFGIILIYNFNLHIRSNFTVISEPRREKAFSYAEKIFRDIHEKDAVFFVFGANQIIPLQYYKYETM
ncbi:DUF2723 domain-containing protein, partial [bacterium]|nr:DUF2723 domain-containing protein [bacterium]